MCVPYILTEKFVGSQKPTKPMPTELLPLNLNFPLHFDLSFYNKETLNDENWCQISFGHKINFLWCTAEWE